MDIRQNPFLDRGQWYWRSEEQNVNGPYQSQMEALRALIRYCDKLTRWQRLCVALREFVYA